MLDAARAEAAERELNRFIDSQSKDKAQANLEAERVRAEDRRRLEEMYREHRALWIHHYRRLALASLQTSRDYRRRARALEVDAS